MKPTCDHERPQEPLGPLAEANRKNLCKVLGIPDNSTPCHQCHMIYMGFMTCTTNQGHEFLLSDPYSEQQQEAMHACTYGSPAKEELNRVLSHARHLGHLLALDTPTEPAVQVLRAMRRATREADDARARRAMGRGYV